MSLPKTSGIGAAPASWREPRAISSSSFFIFCLFGEEVEEHWCECFFTFRRFTNGAPVLGSPHWDVTLLRRLLDSSHVGLFGRPVSSRVGLCVSGPARRSSGPPTGSRVPSTSKAPRAAGTQRAARLSFQCSGLTSPPRPCQSRQTFARVAQLSENGLLVRLLFRGLLRCISRISILNLTVFLLLDLGLAGSSLPGVSGSPSLFFFF